MSATKIWGLFIAILLLAGAAGFFVIRSHRAEPGGVILSMEDEYRKVDPALIGYVEVEPLVPTIGGLSALTIAPDGKIYVGGRNAIEVFPDRETFEVNGKPSCIAVDADGLVFVGFVDYFAIFSRERKSLQGVSFSTNAYVTSIAVDDDYIYVADAGNRSVWRYSKEGNYREEIGAKNPAEGIRGFNVPSPYFDLAVATNGSIWVVNPGYHAFENYSPGGKLISTWEKTGFRIEAFSGCCNPAHFALMPDGSFLTAEKKLVRIKIHNTDGSLRCVVAAPNQFDKDADGLDVAVDQQGRVYVLDPNRGKVRVFEKKKS